MPENTFRLHEATIEEIQFGLRLGTVSCRRLVDLYLARIEAYDKNGPKINSIVNVNPRAGEEADRLDRMLREGKVMGPLHGVPVVVKDLAQTVDMPTTFGSVVFKSYRPRKDAAIVSRLRAAGAVILAKVSLPDWATAWFGISSVSGDTLNPYALDRDPGGSSGGTGAAVAANLAAVGIGSDTGGSIRVPSSFNNLVGVRVTTGLISRAGMSPLVHFQDTAGPMTRTVRDAAAMLDVLVGYDADDPFTVAALQARERGHYVSGLAPDAMSGARIGVMRERFGADSNPQCGAVNRTVNRAIEAMKAVGAEIVEGVTIPDLDDMVMTTALYIHQSKHDFNVFLAGIPDAPLRTVEEIHSKRQFHERLDLFDQIAQGPAHPEDLPDYYMRRKAREDLLRAVLNAMGKNRLDALLYPDVQVPPPLKSEVHSDRWTVMSFPTNTLIASQAGLPAISMPAGFTDDGLPVGVELVGKPYDEAALLRLAYSYERAFQPRRAPDSAPPLAGEK
jgi:amidase